MFSSRQRWVQWRHSFFTFCVTFFWILFSGYSFSEHFFLDTFLLTIITQRCLHQGKGGSFFWILFFWTLFLNTFLLTIKIWGCLHQGKGGSSEDKPFYTFCVILFWILFPGNLFWILFSGYSFSEHLKSGGVFIKAKVCLVKTNEAAFRARQCQWDEKILKDIFSLRNLQKNWSQQSPHYK